VNWSRPEKLSHFDNCIIVRSALPYSQSYNRHEDSEDYQIAYHQQSTHIIPLYTIKMYQGE